MTWGCECVWVSVWIGGSSGHWRILVLQTSTLTDIYNLTGLTFLLALTFTLQTYSGRCLAVVLEGRGKWFYLALRAGAADFSDGVVWLSNYFYLQVTLGLYQLSALELVSLFFCAHITCPFFSYIFIGYWILYAYTFITECNLLRAIYLFKAHFQPCLTLFPHNFLSTDQF